MKSLSGCGVGMVLATTMFGACGPSGGRDDNGETADAAPARPDAPNSNFPDAGPPDPGEIYAHSSSNLFKIDPIANTQLDLGPFIWPNGNDNMTDIAIDKDGNAVGISFNSLYAVNLDTAQCTLIASIGGGGYNGLSYLPAGTLDPTTEALVATDTTGAVTRINPVTGAATLVGNYGGGFYSSGDIVSVTDFGTVATAAGGGNSTDTLVSVNPATGAATAIGEIGYSGLWGLAFWGGTVYGFSQSGQIVSINPSTGVGTLVTTMPLSFWGGGVTTVAPIVVD